MITKHGRRSACAPAHLAWLDRACQALETTFGERFQAWMLDGSWGPTDDLAFDGLPPSGNGVGDVDQFPEPSPPPAELFRLLDPAADAPRTMPDKAGEAVWLAVPLVPPTSVEAAEAFADAPFLETQEAGPGGAPVQPQRAFAIGRIAGAGEPLVVKFAELFMRDAQRQTNYDRLATENRTLLRHITHDFEELSFLRSMAALLDVSDRTFDLKAMAQTVLPTLRPLCEAAMMVMFEANQDDPQSPETPLVWCGPRTIDDATCRRLIETFRTPCAAQPVVYNDFQETTYASQFPNVDGFVLLPIVNADETIGWLLALNRENEHDAESSHGWNVSYLEFGTHEASLMASAATILATHSRNMDLFRERERLVVSVVRALVTAIEAKDEYTRGHSERVALYGKRLAEELGFDAEYCERLYLTGLLHDVGKIGVSDAVLRKPGALSPAELAEIKQHPDKGWAILSDVEPLTYVLPGVLHHHEQFDGGGYPDALAGTGIHVDGRILAVADAYDAMTSDRPYRQGMPHEQAEQILRAGSGKQWDSQIINVFFRVVPDILQIKQTYRPRTQACRQKARPNSPPNSPPAAATMDAATTAAVFQFD